MQTGKIISLLLLFMVTSVVGATQQDAAAGELKEAALRDAACTGASEAQAADTATVSAVAIRGGGRELGTIIAVQGACHCQSNNCDTLVYLRNGDGYRLALRERYASLHPVKVVKRGMPSLTGKLEVSAQRTETTVYDWDGKEYRPSLCATVIKRAKIPSISQHPCKAPAR
jgi:hypothetical protein